MKRSAALKYVAHSLDDALNVRTGEAIPDNARLVGWLCGFEPVFVAVWSYLPDVVLSDEDAEEIAADYLDEKSWFSDGVSPADYVI